MRSAKNMNDAELAAALKVSDAEIDAHEAVCRDPDYEGYGGSPGEGMYAWHEELSTEKRRRQRIKKAGQS